MIIKKLLAAAGAVVVLGLGGAAYQHGVDQHPVALSQADATHGDGTHGDHDHERGHERDEPPGNTPWT